MSSSRFQRVKEIYYAAFDESPATRTAFIEQAAGGDAELVQEVLRLFAYENDPRNPAIDAAALTPLAVSGGDDDRALPERIGGYKIVRRIGAGGMGTVYLAEQEAPRRLVALKTIRPDVAGDAVMRRFRFESELLGRLQHPAIAQIHEARHEGRDGAFIAMEYIEGHALDEWIRVEKPAREVILDLLAEIADGVHHAHVRGIIHRDLKPANVLVDRSGAPKIIDFGIARSADPGEADTGMTRFGEVLGTLAYMSPEQAGGRPEDVDLRTDVYSLGVIAFRCLFDELPSRLTNAGFHEAVREIVELPVKRPRSLDPTIENDLETILLTALEKDPNRRYQSAAAFAEDIRAYREHRPIVAHPPSAVYQLKMYARRHRALVASLSLLLVAILAGLHFSIRYAIRADREADAASKEKAAATRSAADAARSAAEAQRNADRAEASQYAAEIRSAAAAIDAARAEEARRILDGTPRKLRGWEYDHLCARLDGAERVFGEREELVEDVAFSRDGRIAVLARSGELSFVSCADGERRTISVGKRPVAFDLSRTADEAVVADASGVVRLIATADGRVIAERSFDGAAIERVAFDPSGKSVLVTIRRAEAVWRPADDSVTRLAVSLPAGRTEHSFTWCEDQGRAAFVQGRDSTIFGVYFVDPATGRRRGRLPQTSENVRVLAFSPDGRRVALGTSHPSVQVIDIAAETVEEYRRGLMGAIGAVAWLADGKRYVTGDSAGGVALWEIGVLSPLRLFLGADPRISKVCIDPAGHRIAVASPGRVRVWSLLGTTDVVERKDHASYVWNVAFNPDGDILATAAWDGTVRLCDGWTLQPIGFAVRGEDSGPAALGWSANGEILRFAARNGSVRTMALRDELARKSSRAEKRAPAEKVQVAWPGRLVEDGPASSPDGRIRVLPERRRLRVEIAGKGGTPAHSIPFDIPIDRWAFDRAGTNLALAGREGGLWVLAANRAYEKVELAGHDGKVYDVAFSPDGRRLVSGGSDRTLRLWDTGTWSEVAVLHGFTGDVRALAFSDDGVRLAVGASDRSVSIFAAVARHRLTAAADDARRRRRAMRASGAVDEPGPDRVYAALEAESRPIDERPQTPEKTLAFPAGSGAGEALAFMTHGPEPASSAVLIGLPGAAPLQSGAVELWSADLSRRFLRLGGRAITAAMGAAVAVLPDLDGDGTDDFMAASTGSIADGRDGVGAIEVYSGRSGRSLLMIDLDCTLRDTVLEIEISAAGDLDGDGKSDIFAVLAPKGGDVLLQAFSSASGRRLWNLPESARLRRAAAPVADQDGDGRPDICVAGPGADLRFYSGASGAFIRSRETPFPDAEGFAGLSVMGAGDERRGPAVMIAPASERREKMTMLATSGVPDERAWKRTVPGARRFDRLFGLSDVDGDGFPDAAVRVRREFAPYGDTSVTVISGAAGGEILSIDAGPDDDRFGGDVLFDPASRLLYIGAAGNLRPTVQVYRVPAPVAR